MNLLRKFFFNDIISISMWMVANDFLQWNICLLTIKYMCVWAINKNVINIEDNLFLKINLQVYFEMLFQNVSIKTKNSEVYIQHPLTPRLESWGTNPCPKENKPSALVATYYITILYGSQTPNIYNLHFYKLFSVAQGYYSLKYEFSVVCGKTKTCLPLGA